MTVRPNRQPLGERLKEGLDEALRHARGEIELPMTLIEIPAPPPHYGPADVLRVRQQLHMSQSGFAAVLHVSLKTVQSWEQGERNPSHAAARLLQAIEQPELLSDFVRRQRERGQSSRRFSRTSP